VTRSARSAVPVPVLWQRGHIGPKGSTVVHRWTGSCNLGEELMSGGTDDVCKCWLVSVSADYLLIRNAALRSCVTPA